MKVIRKDLNVKEQNFYFASDLHFGNKNSDVNHFLREMREAKERNCRILLVGDMFDAIFPFGDRRHNPSLMINALAHNDKAPSKAVDMLAEILKPYADNIDVIGLGNHEFSVYKYLGFDMIDRLIEKLSAYTDNKIYWGDYTGYMVYNFSMDGQNSNKLFWILYHHGSGGGAPVTKGMIDISRKEMRWLYDIYIFGHKHEGLAGRGLFLYPYAPQEGDNGILLERPNKGVEIGNFLKNYVINKDNSLPRYEERYQHAPKPIGGTFCKVELKRVKTTFGKRIYKNLMFKVTVEE